MQNVYGCLFLRTTFVVTNLAEIGGLRLTSHVDDGFVAWINGTEVLRVRVPGAPGSSVSIATLADNAPSPGLLHHGGPPRASAYLVPGTNVLAVQVFQSSLSSSDLGFDCALESIVRETTPPTVQSVSRRPARSPT